MLTHAKGGIWVVVVSFNSSVLIFLIYINHDRFPLNYW